MVRVLIFRFFEYCMIKNCLWGFFSYFLGLFVVGKYFVFRREVRGLYLVVYLGYGGK